MPSEYPRRAVDQTAREKKKRQLAEMRRSIAAAENSRPDPTLVARTLTITKQEDNYLFNYVDVFLRESHRALDEKQAYILIYNKFCESLRALWYNIDFVFSMVNFGLENRKGTIIDMDYLNKSNFVYSSEIRSSHAHKSVTHAIKSKEAIIPTLITLLNKSQDIVMGFDDTISQIKLASPKLYEKICSQLDIRTKLVTLSLNLITALENDKVNIDKFSDEIYFGVRPNHMNTI